MNNKVTDQQIFNYRTFLLLEAIASFFQIVILHNYQLLTFFFIAQPIILSTYILLVYLYNRNLTKRAYYLFFAGGVVLFLIPFTFIEYGSIHGFTLNSANDFKIVRYFKYSTYHITDDITFTENDYTTKTCVVSEFNGVMYGNDHTIDGLTKPFICVSEGSIYDLTLDNVDIENFNAQYGPVVGANAGELTNVHVFGTLTGNGGIGGIVGFNQGTIINSSFDGTITSSVGGGAGGIASTNTGTIETSYSAGTITGSNYYVAGLVGDMKDGTLTNSYTTANITGTEYVGGVAGQVSTSATISSVVVEGNISGSKVGVVSYNYWNYEQDYILFTGTIDADDYVYELTVLYTQPQSFHVNTDNQVDITTITAATYSDTLGLNTEIWELHPLSTTYPTLITNP